MVNFILFSSSHCFILAHSIRDVSAELKLTGTLIIVRSSANLNSKLLVRANSVDIVNHNGEQDGS